MKILYFKNDKCSVCEAMLPKIKKVADDYNIDFEVIDVIKNPEIAGQNLVLTVPTVLFVDNGTELTRFARNFSVSEIVSFIERYLEFVNN
ncbi:glutaredoxin [Thermosipho melanesiensis]|uniref:Glutaredoxin 2 n=2 Tax=Thermosipho melanesiensis TaxID=46541 RepID=A6LNI8_THEM4|nr:thioredoxin family protein [Thermosipho melanesiensis]ABR31489.1 glutaredoxin 2 [Thermosipho melanesiensis BI429]APT74546.1 glutaredoxin [Thermosipho melanesiensis]OOC36496.1 glutaredoxin [Thermosipho melanesiensis]OOC37314.1 glutaredoxin [Thermosipho melanesiensis]OOC38067.1 glutaredoxin [Thermosipho melanesiensis]